jgi:hypothetical protein
MNTYDRPKVMVMMINMMISMMNGFKWISGTMIYPIKKKQGHAKGQGEELKILGTPASFDLVLSIWVFHGFPMGLGQTQVKINQS